ncbi:hypothetical protein BH18VER2_BH18VER2_16040 [soil metagenome]
MDEELLEKAEAFARERGGKLGELLGFGIHGIVVVLESERKGAARQLRHSYRNHRVMKGTYSSISPVR